jgi:hypothetical protein
MANRVAEVNRELKRQGYAAKLVAGRGYYYFVDSSTEALHHVMGHWSIYVYRANEQTVSMWLADYEMLRKKNGLSHEEGRTIAWKEQAIAKAINEALDRKITAELESAGIYDPQQTTNKLRSK